MKQSAGGQAGSFEKIKKTIAALLTIEGQKWTLYMD